MDIKSFSYLVPLTFSLMLSSCGSATTSNEAKDTSQVVKHDSPADTTQLPPVETGTANTEYKPAFAGQTRIGGVKTKTAYKVDEIATKLGSPWAVVPTPDGRLIVTDKTGFMQLLGTDGKVQKKITGFP